jgi:SMODS-associated and fused to various effectors sensor domain
VTGPLASPTATGVRIAGDRYQWLHVWRACLQVLRDGSGPMTPANPAIAVGVEADAAGNVDDVILYRQRPPHTYSQVKWAANASSPIGLDYLTEIQTAGGSSLLAKFAAAHALLAADGQRPDMVLRTNRNIDPSSVLLSGLDTRRQLLMPNAAKQGPRSARGKERAVWARSARVTEADLLRLLGDLRFETGYGLQLLEDNVTNLMAATGLRSDAPALLAATGWIAQLVINGTQRIELDTIRSAVADLNLSAGRIWATVSIATLKPDPIADQALYGLDWVDRFDGDDPYTRRRPKPPATWDELAADLADLPNHLAGVDAVLITDSLRLATGFAVGSALRKVTGVDVAWKQGPQLWNSDHPYHEVLTPRTDVRLLGQGDDTAIVVDIATTATPDVIDWLQTTKTPVRDAITVSMPSGRVKDDAITDPAQVVALAVGIRDVARCAARTSPRIHLFMACPAGLALLLGHRWNRVTTTLVYEDLKTEYIHAYSIAS